MLAICLHGKVHLGVIMKFNLIRLDYVIDVIIIDVVPLRSLFLLSCWDSVGSNLVQANIDYSL